MTIHVRESESKTVAGPSIPQYNDANMSLLRRRDEAQHLSPWTVLLVVRHPVGGIRTFFRYVFQRFSIEKYRFTLIAPDCAEARLLLEDLGALELNFIPLGERASNLEFLRAVTHVIRTAAFDLIYSHGYTSAMASVVGSLLTRTPHLVTCHDVFTEGQFAGLNGVLERSALGLCLATADRIHCVTEDAKENLLDYLPILRLAQDKILAIRNGIETARFQDAECRNFKDELKLDEDCFIIGFLGRFMSQKGFRYLVDALVEMQKRDDLPRKAIILTISAQDGYFREEMADIERRGLSSSVLFLPFVANVASSLKGMDVVAVPSLWEACGLLAMEAMVAGVPVVGTNCVGLREVLADTPAKVVPTRDASALANALIAEMLEPTTVHAREFSLAASTRFAVEKQAEEIEQLLSELLNQRVPKTS